MSSLTNIWEPFSFLPFRMMSVFTLWVVKEAMTSCGVALPSPFRPTLCDRTMSCAAIFTSSFFSASSRTTTSISSPAFSGIPRILITLRREYCLHGLRRFGTLGTGCYSPTKHPGTPCSRAVTDSTMTQQDIGWALQSNSTY